jgi:hypothetical protein
MANYPFMKIYTCSESVVNADYIDIAYNLANCKNIISVTAISDNNINVFASDITISTARLNFSSKYTGTVKYTVMGIK